jgi:hypothetical protein
MADVVGDLAPLSVYRGGNSYPRGVSQCCDRFLVSFLFAQMQMSFFLSASLFWIFLWLFDGSKKRGRKQRSEKTGKAGRDKG